MFYTSMEAMAAMKEKKSHEVHIGQQKKCQISGVIEVDRFDSDEVILKTHDALLKIIGTELQMKELLLEQGIIQFEGNIEQLQYSHKDGEIKKNKGFLAQFFR